MPFKNSSGESQLSVTRYVPAAVAAQPKPVNVAAPFLSSIRKSTLVILKKPGWHIKRLTSHRRSRTLDDGETSTAEKERRLSGKPPKPSKRRSCSLFSEPNPPSIHYHKPTVDLFGEAQAWRLTSQPRSEPILDLLEALALDPTEDEKTLGPTSKKTLSKLRNHGTDEFSGTPQDPLALDCLLSRLGTSGILPILPEGKDLEAGVDMGATPEEIEDIVEWWDEFGFEGVGRMVGGKGKEGEPEGDV